MGSSGWEVVNVRFWSEPEANTADGYQLHLLGYRCMSETHVRYQREDVIKPQWHSGSENHIPAASEQVATNGQY